MKALSPSLLFAITALALAGTALSQVPSTNDISDTFGNTGMGTNALVNLNTGLGLGGNTASGADALNKNTSGSYNTAFGASALLSNTTGNDNTAVGLSALVLNTSGSGNSASGFSVLFKNTTGGQNTASGMGAMYNNKTGDNNTASVFAALFRNTSGNDNIAEGFKAGFNLTTGRYNIDIGNRGVTADSGIIRIGTAGQQNQAFIAGINNSTVTGAGVVVDPSTGQLGVLASSERYKTAITPIGKSSEKLQQLRPVSFHLKADPNGAVQYGLIAEEVNKVYPELVIRDASGKIQGVRYDELAPMLLNEVQQQAAEIRNLKQQASEMRDLKQQVAELKDLNQLKSRFGDSRPRINLLRSANAAIQ
jgi:hypothetical protein